MLVYSVRKLGLDHGKVNVNGGAIALGHPLDEHLSRDCSPRRWPERAFHAPRARGRSRRASRSCIGEADRSVVGCVAERRF